MDNNFKPINMPQFDLSKFNLNSPVYDMAQQISRSMEEGNRQIQKETEEIYKRQETVRQAALGTAENTEEMKGDLHKVVHNQKNYIALLEQMVDNQKQQIVNQELQLRSSEEMLSKLKVILEFSEMSTDLQDEIAEMICDEITEKHPELEYIADKGRDIAIAGIVAMLPHVLNGLKLYLMSKGILGYLGLVGAKLQEGVSKMFLSKIHIENYRLLNNVDVVIDKSLTLVVGKNNTGKTSVMQLLSSVLEKRPLNFDDYPLSCRKTVYDLFQQYWNGKINAVDFVNGISETKLGLEIDYSEELEDDSLGGLSPFVIDLDMD